MMLLVFGLIVFHALHSIRMVAPKWRAQRVKNMGENMWKGMYSLVTLAALVLIVFGYQQAKIDAVQIWSPPVWGRHLAIVLMLISFLLIPFNMRSSRLKSITHHPFLMAILLWSTAHLLANGDGPSVILFGSFFVWALWNWLNVRKRNGPLPQVPPLKQDLFATAIGIGMWLFFLVFAHKWLFGVSPIS